MPRTARQAPGGIVFHVLNRGVGRMNIFHKDGDYRAFERVLEESLGLRPMRLCSYCMMRNHWHLVLWPRSDGDLAAFMQRLTITHVRRWQEHRRQVGVGHLYQGRYKSFPVQSDHHFLTVCRYVERNALRAGLVRRAEDWPWGGLWRRVRGDTNQQAWLSDGPVAWPGQWTSAVNRPERADELRALRLGVTKGRPFGASEWESRTIKRLGLESTIRPRGRPRTRGPIEI